MDRVYLAVVSGWYCRQSLQSLHSSLATRWRLAVVLSWGIDSNSAALPPYAVCVLVIMF